MTSIRARFAVVLCAASMLAACGGEDIEDIGVDEDYAKALPTGAVRVASFNTSLHRLKDRELIDELATGTSEPAKATAEIVQRVRPDVVLLNEVDYDEGGEAAQLLQDKYFSVKQHNQKVVKFAYRYPVPTNTGLDSGFDLDNDGKKGQPGDCFGFGEHPGAYGFVIFSRYPIAQDEIRSFQKLLWKDMPGAKLPKKSPSSSKGWYDAEEIAVLRLSSKNHVDVPVDFNGRTIHILAAHPTPPAFDGPEDRNGLRNQAEVRLWIDYLTPGSGDWMVDDQGNAGGLAEGERFVIVGDHNADPLDGASGGTMAQLLEHPRVNTSATPRSTGGSMASEEQGGVNGSHDGDPANDTGDFNDQAVGNLRIDYALPSTEMQILDAQVYWPKSTSSRYHLITHSDHRMVWVDLKVY